MSPIPTRKQVSSGGVVYRRAGDQIEIALISVAAGEGQRWQLPKGLMDSGEEPEATALREVREEAGVESELVQLIDRIDYWYVSGSANRRVRFHKNVYFYLLRYRSGDVANHDHEVLEARWMPLEDALERLAFDNEKQVVQRAAAMISELEG